jgi:DNA primase
LREENSCQPGAVHSGGYDRFSINPKEQVWNCRGCAKGGDAISLVAHLDGLDNKDADRERGGARCQMQKSAAWKFHRCLPLQ